MKMQLLATSVFLLTGAVAVFYPVFGTPKAIPDVPTVTAPQTSTAPLRIDAVFVLDTTGSMEGLIAAAKEKIWSIATTMAQADPAPVIRLGLVAYRDRGDAYVTKVIDLSSDLDAVYAALMHFEAAGGGDEPESVNQALYEAVEHISWTDEADAYKVIFLVGDAPAHMDYPNDVKYPTTLGMAKQRGIVVNAVQCGTHGGTRRTWKQVAQLGSGSFFQVDQDGGAVAIASPMDEEIAMLSRELDSTRLYYGTPEERAVEEEKVDRATVLHDNASLGARARRAIFNASESGKANLLGHQELIDDVSSGKVVLEDIEREALPSSLKELSPTRLKAAIDERTAERDAIVQRIERLTQEREAYLRGEVEKDNAVERSLDHKIFGAVRAQAKSKGFSFDSDAPAY